MDRRGFVKASVAVAGAGAMAALAGAGFRATVTPRGAEDARLVPYFGAHRIAGPAPRGLPYLPLALRDGRFVVKRRLRHMRRDIDVLDWLRYCNNGELRGLRDEDADERIFYHKKRDHDFVTPWYAEKFNELIRPQDFPHFGFGAAFRWRGDLTGVILRLDPARIAHRKEVIAPATPLNERDYDFVRREIFHEEFAAVIDWCTHWCCHAGYREAEPLARPRNAWDNVFCTCHNANFDPAQPVAYVYEPGSGPLPWPAPARAA